MTSLQRMLPLSAIPSDALRHIDFLLFDVDETFTTHGLLHAETYASLFALRDAGITAIPVTGRPSGWGNVMLSTWPIKACVTENGGVISWRDSTGIARQQVIHEAHRGDELAQPGPKDAHRLPSAVRRIRPIRSSRLAAYPRAVLETFNRRPPRTPGSR